MEGWNGKSRGGGFGYAFFVFLIRHCGTGSAYAFLALVVIYFIPCAPRATAAVWDYYRKRLHCGVWRSLCNLYLHYYRFGQTLIDKIAIGAGLSDRYHFRFDNYDEFLSVLQGGQGVILLGAHVGCWETGAHFFGEYGRAIHVVMYDAEYARIRNVVERNTERRNYKIIPVNADGLDMMLDIKVALNHGEYVCFQGDRYINPQHTFVLPFLGYDARFPQGPFLLAARLKVPVVFYFAMREKGRGYRFIFTIHRPEATVSPEALCREYLQALEKTVRRYPHQWFNLYKFWS